VDIEEEVEIGKKNEIKLNTFSVNTALKSSKGRELVEKRTRYSKTFKMKNGKRKLIMSNTPIHYKESDKEGYKEIKPKLSSPESSGQYLSKKSGYSYFKEITDGLYRVYFKENLSENRAIKIANKKGESIFSKVDEIGYYNTESDEYQKVASLNLIYEKVNGDDEIVFICRNTGLHVNFEYKKTNFKIKIDKNSASFNSLPQHKESNWKDENINIVLPIKYSAGTGVNCKLDENETENIRYTSVNFVNDSNERVYTILSKPDTISSQTKSNTFYEQKSDSIISYKTIDKYNTNTLSKTTSTSNGDIIETIGINSGDNIIAYWIEGGQHLGGIHRLLVGNHIDYPLKRTYIKFLILKNNLIPEKSEIHDANLGVYYYKTHRPSWSDEDFVSRTINVSASGEILDSRHWGQPPQSFSYNVTSAIQKWVNREKNTGFTLWASNEDVEGYDMRMRHPELNVAYTPPKLKITEPEKEKIVDINSDPSMPEIYCKIGENSTFEGKNISWKSKIEYNCSGHTGEAEYTKTKSYQESKNGWNWDLSEYDQIIGGEVTLSAKTTVEGEEFSDEITIYIRGENPEQSEVEAELSTTGEKAVLATENNEIDWNQFSTENYSDPSEGLPRVVNADWGVASINSYWHDITTGILWDWTANVDKGIEIFDNNESAARTDLQNQSPPNTNIPQKILDCEKYAKYQGGGDAGAYEWSVPEGAPPSDGHWEHNPTNPEGSEELVVNGNNNYIEYWESYNQ